MGTLRIRLLGRISIQQDGQHPTELPTKPMELLAYLLLYRDRAHARESLSGVLWPDAKPGLSRKYLRQALWQLQSTSACSELLELTPGWVRVNPTGPWWCDVGAFEQAYTRSRDLAGRDLTDQQARALGDAAALYRGDLLETVYQDWCVYERERLQQIYLAMLDTLMGYCEIRGLYGQGVAHGHRILRYDAARESTHRQLMRLHHLAGDRTTALRQYDRCAQALAREFALTPAPETVALRQQIIADDLGPGDDAGGRRLVELRRELASVQDSVSALRDQVQRMLNDSNGDRPGDAARDATTDAEQDALRVP